MNWHLVIRDDHDRISVLVDKASASDPDHDTMPLDFGDSFW